MHCRERLFLDICTKQALRQKSEKIFKIFDGNRMKRICNRKSNEFFTRLNNIKQVIHRDIWDYRSFTFCVMLLSRD